MYNYQKHKFPFRVESIRKDSTACMYGNTCLDGFLRQELVMAQFIIRRSKYYARIRTWANDVGKEKEEQIPLRTDSEIVALERLSEVNKVESYIKKGIVFTFPWSSDDVSVKVKRFTIKEAKEGWITNRKTNGIRPKTIEINENGFKLFTQVISENSALSSIDTQSVDKFVNSLKKKGLSTTSINIHLRTIKAMLRYYWKREILKSVPIIEQLKQDEVNPIYITDTEFQGIMELDWLNEFYKRLVYFYRETGCRLREPFISNLDDNWLDIPNLSKGKKPRSIHLTETLKKIYCEIQSWNKSGYGSKLVDPARHISKMFKKALTAIGADESKRFHSLRHTYAIRRILENESIYSVQKKMGHSSITSTEVYLKLDLKRISQDFPTISALHRKSQNKVFRDTNKRNNAFVENVIPN